MIEEERNKKQKECLKGLRLDIGFNQREMSEKLGIPLRTWEDWESGRRAMPDYQLRMMVYYIKLTFSYKKDGIHSVNIIRDEKGNAIVVINDIRFKDRQNIDWHAVEEYLYEYVVENIEILLISISLAMDAFAVAICKGLSMKK